MRSRALPIVVVALTCAGCEHLSWKQQFAMTTAVVVAASGGTAVAVMSQSREYDPALRDDEGLLVPVARQEGSPPLLAAAVTAGATLLLTGLLVATVLSEPIELPASTSETPPTPPPPDDPRPAGDAPPEPTAIPDEGGAQ